MNVAEPGSADVAVLLPGTGSDDTFVRSVFEAPFAAVCVRAVTPAPVPGPLLAEASFAALDEAAERHPVIAGGVSFGAHLAAEWALANPDRCAGLVLALPGWHGDPGDAPGAVSARVSADLVRSRGVEGALAVATDGVPRWLADELTRSWRGHGDGLAGSLSAAADRQAPTLAALSRLDVPTGIATCTDDPVHPTTVAEEWLKALPRATMCTTRLDIVGTDPEALGRAAVLAWLRAGGLT
ncbi:alpha/beta fold hydrolase [Actinophytocola glycyrrhizae]|uniref:Alpha/beta fold hydrolase n=1 Tax=Actinophytocola glycyrrhizae TaxID=2044873 RepID=A0ABV9SDL7_9PSEU